MQKFGIKKPYNVTMKCNFTFFNQTKLEKCKKKNPPKIKYKNKKLNI